LARLQWTPDDILTRALGAGGLAGINAFLNKRTGQLVSFLKNGDMLDWLIIAADLFNLAPDTTGPGKALDAATDAAIFDLFTGLFTSRLSAVIPSGLTALIAQPATPAAATAAGLPVSAATGTSGAGSAGTPTPSPIPAASMSAVGDVATAGY
jgi:hypothetical protein